MSLLSMRRGQAFSLEIAGSVLALRHFRVLTQREIGGGESGSNGLGTVCSSFTVNPTLG